MLVNLDEPKNHQCEELSFTSSNSNTQSLISYEFPYLIMNISQDNDNVILVKPTISFNSEITLTIPNPVNVIIDAKKDNDAWVASSQKYYKYLGIGKTEKDARKAFKKSFEHPIYGEKLTGLINYI